MSATRASAPATLTEQEADVYCCLLNVTQLLRQSLFRQPELTEVAEAITKADNLLNCLDQVAEQREEVGGSWPSR